MRTELSQLTEPRTAKLARASRIAVSAALTSLVALAASPASADLKYQTTLKGSDAVFFGRQTAISDDGTVLLALAREDPSSSCVTVWRRGTSAAQWTREPVGSYHSCDHFRVALSGDGKLVAIADKDPQVVALHAFDGTGWPLVQKLTKPNIKKAKPRTFATGVAVSGDGNTLLAGATTGISSGIAYVHVFVKQGSAWKLQHTILHPDFGFHSFGDMQFQNYLALAHDGNTAVVDADKTVHVFARSGATWTQTAVLAAPVPLYHPYLFGRSFSISADGNLIAVEAVRVEVVKGSQLITFELFAREGAAWVWRQSLVPSGLTKFSPGASSGPTTAVIGLSSDGDTALIGMEFPECQKPGRCGAALVFEWNGAQWVQVQILKSGGPTNAYQNFSFGQAVALSADAKTAAVGAPGYPTVPGPPVGVVFVYTDGPKPGPKPCAGAVFNPSCLKFVPPTPDDPWLYLGCEIIDCCEGCPGPVFIVNWKILVDGAPVDEVVLRFENLDPALARRLEVSGPARWIGPDLLAIHGREEVSLRGFAIEGRARLRISRSSPGVRVERVGLGKRAADSSADTEARDTVRVRVGQYVGDELISSGTLLYAVR